MTITNGLDLLSCTRSSVWPAYYHTGQQTLKPSFGLTSYPPISVALFLAGTTRMLEEVSLGWKKAWNLEGMEW